MSRPTGLKAEESRRTLGRLFAPIQGGLVDADRIFQEELQSRFPFVQALVEHCGDYQGKRLRPALVLLAGGACGRFGAGSRRRIRLAGSAQRAAPAVLCL